MSDQFVSGFGNAAITSLLVGLLVSVIVIFRDARKAQSELGTMPLGLAAGAIRSRSLNQNGNNSSTIQCSWEDLEESILNAYSSGWAWRVGNAFTGIALFVTFSLIGIVLTKNLGAVLSNPATGVADLAANKVLLGNAVEQMGSKFWVSACGVACTLLHSGWAWGWREKALAPKIRQFIDAERADGRMVSLDENTVEQRRRHDEASLETLRTMAADLAASNALHRDAQKIAEATQATALETARFARECRDAVASVDASLQGGLEPLVGNVEKLAKNLLGEKAEEFLAKLNEGFRAGLKQGLADVVGPLELLRAELKDVSPEQALREIADKLHGAITGGASDSTADFRRSMDDMQRVLPALLAEMNAATLATQQASAEAMTGFRQQLADQNRAAGEASEKTLAAVNGVLESIKGASTSMGTTVTQLGAQSGADLTRLLAALEQRTHDATERIVAAAGAADAKARAERGAMAERDEAAFAALLNSLGQMRDRIVATEERALGTTAAVRAEVAAVTQLLTAERNALTQLLTSISAGSASLTAQAEGAQKAAKDTWGATTELSKAVAGLVLHAQAEQALMTTSGNQVREIRAGSEAVEASLRRVSAAVADLLSKELTGLRSQTDASRVAMDSLVSRVESNIVSALTTQVEDLSATVGSLEKVTRAMAERTK